MCVNIDLMSDEMTILHSEKQHDPRKIGVQPEKTSKSTK
jgi:hypothetical protein